MVSEKNYITTGAIALLTSEVYDAIDKSMAAMALFIDLKKAFDTISLKRLPLKMEKIGCRAVILRLLECYLSNRKQTVKIHQTISTEEDIIYGAPQGNILGPLVFIIFIKDLLCSKIWGQVIAYADDMGWGTGKLQEEL